MTRDQDLDACDFISDGMDRKRPRPKPHIFTPRGWTLIFAIHAGVFLALGFLKFADLLGWWAR